MRRTLRRLPPLGGLVLAVLALEAAPAGAHARLVASDPPAGATLDRPPAAVTLRFNEPVEGALGGVRVLGSDGERADGGRAELAEGGKVLRAALPGDLQGAYLVAWRVVSADGHPVQGAFTFTVGSAAPPSSGELERLLAGSGGDQLVGVLLAAARLGLFAGLVLLVGAGAFLVLAWPAGLGHPRARRLALGAWWLALASTLAGIALYGPYAAGLPLARAIDPGLAAEVLGTRTGIVALARLALLLAALPLVLTIARKPAAAAEQARGLRRLAVAGAPLGAALLATPGLAGHASTGYLVPLALLTDLVHLAAAAVWLGGLALLAVAVLSEQELAQARQVVPRFSSIALVAVAVVAASGTVQGWRQVATWDGLVSTTYGRLLLLKVGIVALLVAVAAGSRRLVQQRLVPATALADRPSGPGAALLHSPDAGAALPQLRRAVSLEALLAAAVLLVTSVLVNAVPARSEAGAAGTGRDAITEDRPFSATLRSDKVWAVVTVALSGPRTYQLHLTLQQPDGQPADPPEVTADLHLPEQDTGPLPLQLTKAGPGHYIGNSVTIPVAGGWQLRIRARLTEIDVVQLTTTVPIG